MGLVKDPDRKETEMILRNVTRSGQVYFLPWNTLKRVGEADDDDEDDGDQ